jgi:hypothetical protein
LALLSSMSIFYHVTLFPEALNILDNRYRT